MQYEELSSMMPDGENDEIFEAAEVIEKMIHAKEKKVWSIIMEYGELLKVKGFSLLS